MSIVPIRDQQGFSSLDLWDSFNNLDIWNPFAEVDFPFPFPSLFNRFPSLSREIFPSVETQISWRETPKAHVFKAYLPGFDREEVLVFIDDDRMLQVSTEDGKFISRFKLPDNARTDQIDGVMENGALIVTVGKESAPPQRPNNIRVVEITGDD